MTRVSLVLMMLALAACASSTRNACDPNATSCELDASITPDAPTVVDAGPDAPPKKGFGDPCTDSMQCQSDICILVSTGGVCSQECGTCPSGYGCFGVLGAIDPGQVSYVCVPETSQLCSPCQSDTECTQIGMDRCVTESTGRSYCGRDCSHVTCPTDYDCVDESIGNTIYKECVPHSGACDCQSAAQQGAHDPCTITTTLNTTCAGTSTCAGVSGWGACQPPSSTDNPDATYTDNNCDGIDGDITKGIFVAGGGANTATCGLTYNAPCQTISFGIVRAVQDAKQNVYVQAGTYNEVVVLLNGVNVWGGYDFNWQRGPYTNAANRVTVVGKQDTGAGGDGEWLTVRAHDLVVGVTIGDMILQGPNAQGTGGSSGRDGMSSYVIHAKASSVSLVRVEVVAGNGASGLSGVTGPDAVIVDAQSYMVGAFGGAGQQYTTTCDDSTRGGGGAAATNSCSQSPSSRAMNGGGGGQGGTMDTNCGVFSLDFNARGGDNGANASLVFGSFGVHGNGGSGGGSCGATTPGNPGLVANGAAGGVLAGGYLGGANSLYWYARAGVPGTTGENGSGGGGGGGGGGCDNGTDGYGAGGGGGGAGGCAARGGGGGGGGGGGSFGIVATSMSAIALDTCQLFRATAGSGGAGGTGGRGQSGGSGGGAASHPNTATPGTGGAGAHGGHGGGGGGGQGGRSVGILSTPDSTITGTCSQSQGTAGGGGLGGPSAPTAPLSERDGATGGNGLGGSLEDARQCASTASC
jgi:hypothetical protein